LYIFFQKLTCVSWIEIKGRSLNGVVRICAVFLMVTSVASSPHALQNSGGTQKIVVYTSSGCHKCSALKNWLAAANRQFEERNLENVDVMTELVMKNVVVLSAPALEVDDAVYTEDQFFDGDMISAERLTGILGGNGNGQR
jgi:glutaredoxin